MSLIDVAATPNDSRTAIISGKWAITHFVPIFIAVPTAAAVTASSNKLSSKVNLSATLVEAGCGWLSALVNGFCFDNFWYQLIIMLKLSYYAWR